MFLLTSFTLALAGNLVIDARVPAEVYVDGHPIAKVYYPSVIETNVTPGNLPFLVYMNGTDQKTSIDVPETGKLRVLLGRTGISTGTIAEEKVVGEEGVDRSVQVRAIGGAPLQIRIGNQRVFLDPGASDDVVVPTGELPVSVLSPNSQVIWAKGLLKVGAGEALVFQVSEGRIPEVSGDNVQFVSETR